jgi:hypothetical protein
MRALARRLTCVLLALVAVVAVSTPALAVGDTPIMYFTAEITATYHKVCGHGEVTGSAAAPQWQVLANGAQLPSGMVISESSSAGGLTATVCVTVFKLSPEGTYVVTFTFRDGAVNVLGTAPLAIVAHALWSPGNPGTFVNIGSPP